MSHKHTALIMRMIADRIELQLLDDVLETIIEGEREPDVTCVEYEWTGEGEKPAHDIFKRGDGWKKVEKVERGTMSAKVIIMRFVRDLRMEASTLT